MFLYLTMVDTPEEKRKFERLYTAHRQVMYVAARRILRDEYLAEDAVHQAFVRLIGQLDKADEAQPARTKAFLVVLAQCAALDIYRKRKQERHVPLEQWEEPVPGCGEMPAGDDGSLPVLEKLPAGCALVLRLRYAQGCSYAQIAAILGISEESARKRASRGIGRLRELLKGEKQYGDEN